MEGPRKVTTFSDVRDERIICISAFYTSQSNENKTERISFNSPNINENKTNLCITYLKRTRFQYDTDHQFV